MPLGFKSGKIRINPDCVRITKCNARMEQLVASFTMEVMVVVLILRVFVVKMGLTVAPMQPNVIYNTVAVSGHIFWIC